MIRLPRFTWFLYILLLSAPPACSQSPTATDTGRTAAAGATPAVDRVEPEAPDRERIIVAFGDSLTAGLGVAPQNAYPAILESELRRAGLPYRVINAGVSGDTTAGGLRRLSSVLELQPDIVILELGANDGLRGIALDQIRANLREIIRRLQAAGIQVILAGMKLPPNYGPVYTRGFSDLYQDLAEEFDTPLIPFFLEGVAARPELNQADGIHPNARGYRRVVENALPVLLPLLQAR